MWNYPCRNLPSELKRVDAGPRLGISPKIYRHFLVVAVGQFGDTFEHQNFLLDTGAAPSIINARLVKRLGLETRTSTLSAAGKVVPT